MAAVTQDAHIKVAHALWTTQRGEGQAPRQEMIQLIEVKTTMMGTNKFINVYQNGLSSGWSGPQHGSWQVAGQCIDVSFRRQGIQLQKQGSIFMAGNITMQIVWAHAITIDRQPKIAMHEVRPPRLHTVGMPDARVIIVARPCSEVHWHLMDERATFFIWKSFNLCWDTIKNFFVRQLNATWRNDHDDDAWVYGRNCIMRYKGRHLQQFHAVNKWLDFQKMFRDRHIDSTSRHEDDKIIDFYIGSAKQTDDTWSIEHDMMGMIDRDNHEFLERRDGHGFTSP